MESKFINDETIGYLESQARVTTAQRVEALETNVENVIKFIEEYGKYEESVQQDRTKEIADLQFEVKNLQASLDLKIVRERLAFDKQLRTLRVDVISAAVIVALLVGGLVWVVR